MLFRAALHCLFLTTFSFRASAQIEIGARWLPTDTNYAVISNLRRSNLTTLGDQIAGYSTLGVIPVSDVAAWLTQLISNPSFREGTVRWNPGVPAKCAYNRPGCTKSIHIEVLEYSFNNPDASDCQAYALVAADAILPSVGVLSDGFATTVCAFSAETVNSLKGRTVLFAALASPVSGTQVSCSGFRRVNVATLSESKEGCVRRGITPVVAVCRPRGPISIEILAAPNTTNSSCTYVAQYPQPTQALANQLCNGTCFLSSCVPCNANQTIVGNADVPTNCLPTSGISAALVASIQGAAQCLGPGPIGRYQCSISANNSACAQMGCFPGHASVTLEGGEQRPMRDLRVGDRVRVALPDGSLAWDDVYFFGHRDRKSVASFVQLRVASGLDGSTRSIEITGKHFLPTSSSGESWSGRVQTRAKDVRVGDFVWVEGGRELEAWRVVSKHTVRQQGLWAPYTASGTIIVGGVAASVHSDWYLDRVFDLLGRPDLLPMVYQLLLAPLRLLYRMVGGDVMRDLDNRFDFTAAALSPLAALQSLGLPIAAFVTVVALVAGKQVACNAQRVM